MSVFVCVCAFCCWAVYAQAALQATPSIIHFTGTNSIADINVTYTFFSCISISLFKIRLPSCTRWADAKALVIVRCVLRFFFAVSSVETKWSALILCQYYFLFSCILSAQLLLLLVCTVYSCIISNCSSWAQVFETFYLFSRCYHIWIVSISSIFEAFVSFFSTNHFSIDFIQINRSIDHHFMNIDNFGRKRRQIWQTHTSTCVEEWQQLNGKWTEMTAKKRLTHFWPGPNSTKSNISKNKYVPRWRGNIGKFHKLMNFRVHGCFFALYLRWTLNKMKLFPLASMLIHFTGFAGGIFIQNFEKVKQNRMVRSLVDFASLPSHIDGSMIWRH